MRKVNKSELRGMIINGEDIAVVDYSEVTDMGHMFHRATELVNMPYLDTSNVIDMSYMFSKCTNLLTVPMMDTSNVIAMHGMFSECSSLKILPMLDISAVDQEAYSDYDGDRFTYIDDIFYECDSIEVPKKYKNFKKYGYKKLLKMFSDIYPEIYV